MEEEIAQKCRPALTQMISFSRSFNSRNGGDGITPTLEAVGSWLRAHENVQVMLGSFLVVFAIWWIVRCILSLLINLICPFVVALIAVVCIPQLRKPLLGQNYPAVANLLRNILLKMAENLKTP